MVTEVATIYYSCFQLSLNLSNWEVNSRSLQSGLYLLWHFALSIRSDRSALAFKDLCQGQIISTSCCIQTKWLQHLYYKRHSISFILMDRAFITHWNSPGTVFPQIYCRFGQTKVICHLDCMISQASLLAIFSFCPFF